MGKRGPSGNRPDSRVHQRVTELLDVDRLLTDRSGQLPVWVTYVVLGVIVLVFVLGFLLVQVGLTALLPATFVFISGLGAVYAGTYVFRRSTVVRNTSTERVRSIALGRTELEGVCRPVVGEFTQPFGDGGCLYASWEIEEYRRSGDSREWRTVERGTISDRFYLEDDTGAILVDDPVNASVEISDGNTTEVRVGPGEAPPTRIGDFCVQQDISPTSSNHRRYTQSVLADGTEVYVLGGAKPLEDSDDYDSTNDLIVTNDDGPYPFLVSDRSEGELVSYYRRGGLLLVVFGIFSSAAGLYFMLSDLQSVGLF